MKPIKHSRGQYQCICGAIGWDFMQKEDKKLCCEGNEY